MSKGENALALFEDYERNQIPPPEGLLRPEIAPGFNLWYEAFWELSTDRQYFESGVGPIPFSSILNYPGVSDDERGLFAFLVRRLDKRWMEEYRKGAEAAMKGQKPKQFPRKVMTL